MNALAASVILVSLLALQQAHAQYDPPSAQVRSGVSPEDVCCNEGLFLVIRDSGDPACVREATAERLGLEPLRDAPVAYVPSDMTKANPDISIMQMHGSSRYSHISQYADDVVYTLEGTVTAIRDPIIWVLSDAHVRAAIPVVLSVEKVHKGILESDELTFFVPSDFVIVDGKVATSASSVGIEPYPYPGIFEEFTADEINNATDKRYLLGDGSDQYEVGDNVIVHLIVSEWVEQELSDGTSVVISTGSIIPHYRTPMGQESVYKIQGCTVFDHAGSVRQYDDVVNESRSQEDSVRP